MIIWVAVLEIFTFMKIHVNSGKIKYGQKSGCTLFSGFDVHCNESKMHLVTIYRIPVEGVAKYYGMCVYMSNVRENYEVSFLHQKEVIFLADKLMSRCQNKIHI